jgi:hypothetical protein
MRHSTMSLMALAAAFLGALPTPVRAGLARPDVPTDLEVPTDQRLYLIGHAIGTQNYFCVQTASGFAWRPFGPQATLLTDDGAQIATHFLSANPDEGGTLRPTWQHARDTSAVWANPIATYEEPDYVEPGAIPWLKLAVVGKSLGPDAGHRLAATTFIQRINTVGGVTPMTGCAEAANIGARKLVPYETDYYFYKARH